MQLFGAEPPAALFQITNMPEGIEDILAEMTEDQRNSLLVSLPRSRPESIAVESIEHEETGEATTPLAPQPPEPQFAIPMSSQDPPTPPPFATAAVLPTRSASLSAPSLRRSESRASGHAPTNSENFEEFSARRKRAVKLAKFFGVEPQHFGPTPVLPDESVAESSMLVPEPPTTPPVPKPLNSYEVDVEVTGGGKFWGLTYDDKRTKEVDQKEVLGRLRSLRAG